MPITNEEIINSQVFKAINLIIDNRIQDIQGEMGYMQSTISNTLTRRFPPAIKVRTYEEGDEYAEVPLSIRDIEAFESCISHIKASNEEINNLMFMKLRLLNDYDFTHGDDSDQKAVFGE